MSGSGEKKTEGNSANSVEKLLTEADQLRKTNADNKEPIVLREVGHIDGPRPDMSQLISQHLSALRHVQTGDFRGHDLGIPLKPPPRPQGHNQDSAKKE